MVLVWDGQRIAQMNIDRLINLVARMVVRRGIDAGIDHATRGGRDAGKMTDAEKHKARTSRDTVQRARRGLNLIRRFLP